MERPHQHVCAFDTEMYLSILFSFLPLQNWNAYIGKLGRKDFYFNVSKNGSQLQDMMVDLSHILSDSGGKTHTIGVMINFTLDKAVLTVADSFPGRTFLYGSFTGNDFTTQIKGWYEHLYM